MIRLCVISGETDTLFEWLDAVDPLRFHFTVGSVVSTPAEAVVSSRNSTIHVWICRMEHALRISEGLETTGVTDARLVVIASNFAEVSDAVDKGYNCIVLDGSSMWILVAAIHSAKNGKPFLSPEIIEAHQTGLVELIKYPENDIIASLTSREIEVALLLIEGMSNTEISRHIFASRATVSSHLLSIYRKLNCSNRTEVAIFALKNNAMLHNALEAANTS